MRYSPRSEVVADRENPVSWFLAVTWAPAMAAPCASCTLPRIFPVICCEKKGKENTPRQARRNRHDSFLVSGLTLTNSLRASRPTSLRIFHGDWVALAVRVRGIKVTAKPL